MNIKKIIALAIVTLLALSLLAACGGSGGSSGNGNASSSASGSGSSGSGSGSASSSGGAGSSGSANAGASAPASAPAQPAKPARAVDKPDKPLDLSDDSIYFVIIEGVKYNLLDVTVKDILANGFTLAEDEDASRVVKAGEAGGLKKDHDRAIAIGLEKVSYAGYSQR